MFVAFHKESTKILRVIRQGYWQDAIYKTPTACTKAILNADINDRINSTEYSVLPYEAFKKIEKTEVVTNLMSGKPVTQSVNTPLSCDVSSETYWSL